MAPDLDAMLAQADAALIIGDVALVPRSRGRRRAEDRSRRGVDRDDRAAVRLCVLDAAGPARSTPDDVVALQRARDAGVAQSDAVAAAYYPDDTARQAVARRYLRDNIQYVLGDDEIEGLKTFYRYASELALGRFDGTLRFYDAEHPDAR